MRKFKSIPSFVVVVLLLISILAPSAAAFGTTQSLSLTTNTKQNLIVIPWEGCLVDSVSYRIDAGIDTACRVWPHLQDDLEQFQETSWLQNKLLALSHVLSPSCGVSLTCEFALAVRLLLEEQKLDQGKSVGKTGKYASRFHPKEQQGDNNDNSNNLSKDEIETEVYNNFRGTRPLTVGEIQTNWKQGGMIRDSLLVKYAVKQPDGKYQHPLVALQEACTLLATEKEGQEKAPRLGTSMASALKELIHEDNSSLLITLHDRADLELVKASLAVSGLPNVELIDEASVDSMCSGMKSDQDSLRIVISTEQLPMQLLQSLPKDSTLYVLDSYLDTLQQHVRLFGDYIPRTASGVARTIVPDKQLALLLFSSQTPLHPSIHSAATMHPWIQLLTSLQQMKESVYS
jgi:hypothetical protein